MIVRTALIAAVLLSAGAVHAETPSRTLAVRLEGRDLSTAQGARAFYRDLARAAAEVCGGARTSGPISDIVEFDTCYAATIRQAVQKANAPLVAALANPGKPALRIAGR